MTKRKTISNLLTIGFLIIFLWYWHENPTILSSLKDISILSVILIVLGKTFSHINNGLFTKWTAETLTESKMTIGEGYYIGILTAIGNFFGPLLGGAGIRAVYLKKIHGLTYSKFVSTLMGFYLILFSSVCVWAIVALTALPGPQQTTLILFFSAWLLVLLSLGIAKLPRRNKLNSDKKVGIVNKIIRIIYEIEEGRVLLLSNKKLLSKLVILSFFIFGASLYVTVIEFHAIGASISLPAATLYAVLSITAILFSITPGAIGVKEAILLLVSSTLGVTKEQIIQVAVLDRAVTFGLLFVLFILTRSRRLKKYVMRNNVDT